MTALSKQEIAKIVNKYIGVSSGYLGNFSYSTHAQFYPEYCDLDIDPNDYPGTTRERFIAILSSQSPSDQAKILKGVLERFPLDAEYIPSTRTSKVYDEISDLITRLNGITPIANPSPKITSDIVRRTIADAETLLQTNGAISGVDRVHTMIHGYLHVLCDDQGIVYAKEDSTTRLFKLLRQHHPILSNLGSRSQDIERIVNSFSNILDAFNSIRNNASLAHPNDTLLGKEEAMLVINAARTLIHYLDAKTSK